MVERAVTTFGRLDAAFNNAGVQSPAVETADASGEDFDRMTAINLRGVWNCIKYELRRMREQGSGAIVNCSSIGGLIGLPGRAMYHAAKHGVIGLIKSAALEYAAMGIRINAVCPGTIDTPMVAAMLAQEPDAMKELMRDQPIGRLGRPEEIASAVLWLCSPGASFVMGHALAVDGGYTAQSASDRPLQNPLFRYLVPAAADICPLPPGHLEPTSCQRTYRRSPILRRHRTRAGGNYRQDPLWRRMGTPGPLAARSQLGDDHEPHLALSHQRAAFPPEEGA